MVVMAEDTPTSEAPLPEAVTSDPAVREEELDQVALLTKLDEQNRLVKHKLS